MNAHDPFRLEVLRFLDRTNAARLATCGRIVDMGLLSDDVDAALLGDDFAFPPAFLPLYFVRRATAYGAWISDPVTGSVDVVSVSIEMPFPNATPWGRTGLRLVLERLEAVGDSFELPAVRAIVDAAFADCDAVTREELALAVETGSFDPLSDADVRDLPLVRDLWTDEDLVPASSYAAPLPALFARADRHPASPADYAPMPPRRGLFDAALAAGDVAGAWAELNDGGWTYAECLEAFERIAPHIDPTIASLVRAKLDADRYGPRGGY